MKYKSKFEEKLYDGKWKVIDHHRFNNHTIYTLENIYNDMKLEVIDSSMRKIDRGELSVSGLMHIRTLKEGKFDGRTVVFQKRPFIY